MERRKDAKADSRKIRKMAEAGCTLEEICESMEINYRQIHYSLTTYYTPAVSTKLLKLIKKNVTKKFSSNTSKAKLKAVLLDTSTINVRNIFDVLDDLEEENYIFLFPSIIIEELERMKKNPKFQGHTARKLLSIALEAESKVVITPEISILSGWTNNSDSRIIQTILNYKEVYNITLYTCDKVLALKAKSLELDFHYLEPEHYKNETTNPDLGVKKVDLFSNIEQVNIFDNINLSKQMGFYYIKNRNKFPYYFEKTTCTSVEYPNNPKIFLHKDNIIYRINTDCVEKLILKNFNLSNNSILLKKGVFSENIFDISNISMLKIVQELN